MAERSSNIVAYSLILLAATLLYIYIFLAVPPDHNAHDFGGHIRYVTMMLEQKEVFLHPMSGWMNYHPPLYYFLSTLFVKLASFIAGLDPQAPQDSLGILSIVFYLGFVWYGMRTVQQFVRAKHFHFIALVLLCFWPIAMFKATRINNDVLLYLFYSAAFYHMMRWYFQDTRKDFTYTLIFTSLAIATKSNGLILLLVLAPLLLIKRRSVRQLGWRIWPVLVLFLLISATNWGRIVYYHVTDGQRLVLVPNIILGEGFQHLLITNTPEHLFTLDTKSYFTEPFFFTDDDRTGRQYFPNALLKSSLFGEFGRWNKPQIALLIGEVYLALFVYMAVALSWICVQQRRDMTDFVPFLLGIAIPVFCLFFTRLNTSISLACGQDFRYIYPVLVPLLVVYGKILDVTAERKKPLYLAGMVILLVFAALCYVFTIYQVIPHA